jgi:transcriptional regulator with XRE-family HTH domain
MSNTRDPKLEWAKRILALRRRLQVSQSELGKQMNASAMAVSRWERGVQEPPANVYIQLGNLTGDPECWYFWGRAGMRSEDLMRVLPAVRSRLRKDRVPSLQVVQAGAHASRRPDNLVAIPVLPVVAATHGGKGTRLMPSIRPIRNRCWPRPAIGVPTQPILVVCEFTAAP